MGKVQGVALNSANVRYNNAVDTEKIYNIESDANLQEEKVISFDGGIVEKEGYRVCSFSKYGENQLNVTFNNVSVSEMCAALMAIDGFVGEVSKSVVESPISL